jgi:hypothetical protein
VPDHFPYHRRVMLLAGVTALLTLFSRLAQAETRPGAHRPASETRVRAEQRLPPGANCATRTRGNAAARVARADRTAIRQLLKRKHPANPIQQVDLQGRWATATILDEPGAQTGWTALLKKANGRWRVLMEGQDFTGAGRKYGVPKHLWKRWYLDEEQA